MSIPPQLIRVKRKATEEAPVSFLRLHENKRHRNDHYVYQRQNEQQARFTEAKGANQRPIIRPSRPSKRAAALQSGVADPNSQPTPNNNTPGPASDNVTQLGGQEDKGTSSAAVEPRRFHMSRRDMMLAGVQHSDRPGSRKRASPALFVERATRRVISRTIAKPRSSLRAAKVNTSVAAAGQAMDVEAPAPQPVEEGEPRKYKKPGISKRAAAAKAEGAPKPKAELPSAITNRWNMDMDELAAEMNKYTMEQIGLSLQGAEEEKQREEAAAARQQQQQQQNSASARSSPLRFKPKAPAQRYLERHPEEKPESTDEVMKGANGEVTDESDSDGDYIIETYVRVPASTIMENKVAPHNVGLLVFDDEPDLEYFYGEGEESEDEWAEDEEDENAENYYTADYPDDEVASDDEYDQNPYSYRTGNASDLEEYDVDEESPSDAGTDDKDGFRSYIAKNGLVTKHL